MGEETDIAEPMSSDDVKAAEDVDADEPSKDIPKKRNRHLHKSLCELMEFYLGDVNLSKDRFISQKIQGQPFVYIDLSMFLTFNKVKALTSRVEDLAKALACSETLQVSEDGSQVCRKTPIKKKENEDDCTIYVERLGPDVDHNLLTKVFSEFGPVDYISLPRFSHNGKFKGFAFVEFRDPECAKKALEALNAKGCCLSPHMAPAELMSIKNFESGQEKKKEDVVKDTDAVENNYGKTEANCQGHSESSEIKGENTEAVLKKDIFRKEKRKRKHSEGNDRVDHKKLKSRHSKETDEVQSENDRSDKDCRIEKMSEGKESNEKDSRVLHKTDSNSNDDVTNKKNKSKKKDKTLEQPAVDEEKEKDAAKEEDRSHKNKRKRKHSNDAGVDEINTSDKNNKEESEPVRKKLKSDIEDGTETDVSQAEEEDSSPRKKKKRKKHKKVKKEKSTAFALGLKVLSKREWKQLRNKYLNMQRDTMRSLKQHLSYSKWEKNKPTPPEPEERPNKQEDFIKPGTVVRVILDEPVTNPVAAKSEMRIHPDIRYTDVTEGSTSVYLRAATAELAAALVQARHWPNMEVLQGDDEAEYWKKIKIDRNEHCKKKKYNQRGRAKLLKRAEQYQSKHITTFET